ncbi:DUF3307 domain-containing protein [Pedobacter xixiisoli]|uniref:DUF3307 domain-containing protein n=1 Tax=Pedobacter xixiisoli TaxID=1476464 RepID=A0A285ZU62_9SPHI|nr:DUF3307 domain-containing protein [Pedobacter xixiisoli]SOD13176.1 Protein of unknown function [Pedobacter xixiisoli]
MEIALIKLLLAHILGDFFLQPDKWVVEKERIKLRSGKLYLHIALHIALVFIVFLSFDVWKQALIIGVSHYMIDAAKLLFQKANTKKVWFFADQALHIAVIIICWLSFYEGASIDFGFVQNPKVWLYVFGGLLLTSPTAIIIKVVITRFIPSRSSISLQNAGKFIGILERLLIYIFILTNHLEAVGFLLAAKSIFRFGDLKEGNELKLTEYVLIGTLLSFGIAVAVSLGVTYIHI